MIHSCEFDLAHLSIQSNNNNNLKSAKAMHMYIQQISIQCTTLGVAAVVVQRMKLTESYLRSNRIYNYCVGDWNWNTPNYFIFLTFYQTSCKRTSRSSFGLLAVVRVAGPGWNQPRSLTSKIYSPLIISVASHADVS
jgi:hypothetical protein